MVNWLKYIYWLLLFFGFGYTNGYGQLKADFTTSPPSGCKPVVVEFKDNSTGNPDRWKWEIDQPGIYATKNISALFLNPGSYNIKLTVYKGTDSSSVTRTGLVNVYDIPVAIFEADVVEGCNPLQVKFTNKSIPGSGTIGSAIWDFGDGNSGSAINPIQTFKTSGRYNVTLTVGNSFGCKKSIAYPNFIHVYDSVKADFSFLTIPSCGAPFPVEFRDTSIGNNIIAWEWSFGDGKTSNLRHPTHNYSSVGNYTAQLITKNKEGCTDTLKRTVSVIAGNYLTRFTNPASVCKNSPIIFTNTSTPINLADSAFWDFGDGTTSKVISPQKIYASPGTYPINLQMYFGLCKLSTSGTVTVLPGPQIDFAAAPQIACKPPLTVNLTSQITNGTIERWRIGNFQGPQANPKVTLSEFGSYSVSVIGKSANGCLDTLTRPDYIQIQKPTINSLPGLPYEGCFPWKHTFKATIQSFIPVTSWEWDFGDGRTSNLENPTITYSVQGEYNVRLIVYTESGCSDTIYSVVKGGLKPKVDFTAGPTRVCPSEKVFFTPLITGVYDSLRWSFGDGSSSIVPIEDHFYKDTGYMNVVLRVFNFGCMDSIEYPRMIYVTPPIANFSIGFLCSRGFERKFNDSSFGATSWLWNFGNGVTSTERNPVYVYPDTGQYIVSLRVSDGTCFHTAIKRVIILDERPDFQHSQNGSCDTTVLFLNAQGPQLQHTNILNYAWRFGPGDILPFGGPVVKKYYTSPEKINARLTITDLNGCIRSINKDIDIKLLGPLARIKPSPVFSCAGKTIVFADSSYGNPASPIVKWTWNFGEGRDIVYLKPPFNHTYNDTGYFNLKLKVEDGNGCVDSIRVDSAVGIFKPMANFITPDTIVCPNTEVRFSNLSEGYGLKYRWTLGENDINTNFEPIKKFKLSGKYTIRLQVTDTVGCTSILNRPAYINVGGAIADFSMSDSLASCPPLLVHFKNKSKGATNIQWDFNNGNNSILENPSQTFTQTGTFKVKLTITGNGGCIDTMVREVIIRGPQGTIKYTPLQGCPPVQVTFSSNTANVKSYIWDYSDGQTSFTTDSTVTYTYLTPGVYRPRVILEDGQSCRIPIQGAEDIKIIGVKSQIKQLKNYQYCDSAVIAFFDSSISNDGIKRWEWDFGDGTRSAQPNPTHKYTVPGQYRVSLLVETFDNCVNLAILPSEIEIKSSPKIEAIRDTSFCLPGSILFKSQWLNPDSTTLNWQWNFGNGTSSALQYPDSVRYNTRGVFQQSLRVTHNNGCSAIVRSSVTVKDRAETYVVVIGNHNFCNSGTVQFKDSTTNENLIDKWKWDFGDGNFSNQRNPVHTYTQPGRYKATLSVETRQNCISVSLLPGNIFVAPSPKVNIGADTVLCLSSQLTFTPRLLNPDTSNITYKWDFGNGTNSTLKNPPGVTFSQPGLLKVKLYTQNEYGCIDSATRQVRVHSDPEVIIGKLSPEHFCDSAVISLASNIVSTDSIKSYLWSFGDGFSSTQSNPSHTYKKPGKFKIGLSVVTVNNCPAQGDYDGEIILSTRPRIGFSSDSVFCGPSTVLFSGKWLNADTSRVDWQWDFGNGVASNKEKPDAVLYDKPGIYQAKLTVSNQLGCADSIIRPIRVNDLPIVLLTQAIPDIFCDSAIVKFTADITSSDSIVSYLWNFGDGRTSSQISPSYSYKKPGNYKVNLSVNTVHNCPATGQFNGNINLASSPKISVLSDSVFCGGTSVNFEGKWLNQDTTVLTWDWDFGNGKTGTGIKPGPVDYQTTGSYNVVATATNNFGCKGIISRKLVFNDIPKVNIQDLLRFVYCDSATIQFRETTVVNGTPISWLWNFGDGTTSNQRAPIHRYTKPGIYPISLNVETSSGCATTSQLTGPVIISQSPVITHPGDTVICIPGNVSFGAQWVNPDTSIIKWSWKFGNGQVASTQNPGVITYGRTGSYRATLLAMNEFGCYDSLSRMIVARDTPNLKISGSVITCSGQEVPLTVSGAVSYRWEPPGSLSCINCANPIARPTATQVYTVTGSNGPGAGCERTQSLRIDIIQPRKMMATPGDSLCIGESYQLIASGFDSYSWSPSTGLSETNISSPVARPQQTTVYRVVGVDSLNCFRDTVYVPVAVYNKPTVNILEQKITGFAGTRIKLETQATETTRWRWSPSTGLSCVTCPAPDVVITQKITYKLLVSNPGGCEAVDEVSIEPICSTGDIFVPNTFSPNGDGRNDIFYPMGRGVSIIRSMKVFNRWGETVFERQNLQPNDPSAGWNGDYKGRLLNPDVYVYMMVVICYNNEELELKGNVTLIK